VNDVETGLTYMQQRYYDPVAGRFLSIDPVVTDANTGGSFNRYTYVGNNPYKYVDPDGRQERAAEAFSDQYRKDFASGNVRDYDPFVIPAAVVTGAMLVGPIVPVVIAGAPAEGAAGAVGGKIIGRLVQGAIKDDVKGNVRQIVKDGGLKRMEKDFKQAIKGAEKIGEKETPKGVVRTAEHGDGTTVSARNFSSSDRPSIQVNDPATTTVTKVRYEP